MGSIALPPRRWVKWVLELLIVALLFVAISVWQTRQMVTGPAPALVGETVEGKRFELEHWRGRPVLVHFWAGWCPVCKVEEGTIAALAAEPDYQVITIAMQSGRADELRALLRERGLVMPVIADSDSTIANLWGVRGVPASFIVDGAGTIRFREMGYTTGIGLRLRLWWAGLF